MNRKTVLPSHGTWIIEASYDIVFWHDTFLNKPDSEMNDGTMSMS